MPFLGQSRASIFLKAWEINTVMKKKDSNCIGILFDQGEAATASNLSEYTIVFDRFIETRFYVFNHHLKVSSHDPSELV